MSLINNMLTYLRFSLLSLLITTNIYTIETDFYVLTIPKSGTHLLIKCIELLSTKKFNNGMHVLSLGAFYFNGDRADKNTTLAEFTKQILDLKRTNVFPISHFHLGPLLNQFLITHPEYATIINIRDLRDTCVSAAFFMKEQITQEIGSSNFDDHLMYIITMKHIVPSQKILNIYRNAEEAVLWYHRENVIVCRFEDLVGEKGGGTRFQQEEQIKMLNRFIGKPLKEKLIQYIGDILFGKEFKPDVSGTFREGQIGSWKKYFKPEHIAAFKEHMGHLQLALGYELD